MGTVANISGRIVTGWAAKDPSGFLSPYIYTLRYVYIYIYDPFFIAVAVTVTVAVKNLKV